MDKRLYFINLTYKHFGMIHVPFTFTIIPLRSSPEIVITIIYQIQALI
jgi:hypothetical protein